MTTTTLSVPAQRGDRITHPVLDVVIPVYKEERNLGPCVERLHGYLVANLRYSFRITVADNRRGRPPLESPVADSRSARVRASGIPIGLARQSVSFVTIGVLSTIAYGLLFMILRHGTGAQVANLLALLITAVANTAANRRLTFGVTGARKAATHQIQGLVVFAVGLGLTSGGPAALHFLAPTAGQSVELAVLVLANLAATVIRFLAMRIWIFRNAPSRAVGLNERVDTA